MNTWFSKKHPTLHCPHCHHPANITSLYPESSFTCRHCQSVSTLNVVDNRTSKDKWLEAIYYLIFFTIFAGIYYLLGAPGKVVVIIFVYTVLILSFKLRFFSNLKHFDFSLTLVDGLSYQQKKANEKAKLFTLLNEINHDFIGNVRQLLKHELLQHYWQSSTSANDQQILLKSLHKKHKCSPVKYKCIAGEKSS